MTQIVAIENTATSFLAAVLFYLNSVTIMKLKVGQVLKAQGIRGELKLSCFLDSPQMLVGIKKLYLGNNPHSVVKIRTDGTFVFVQLENIADRNVAETYRGWDVFCEKSDVHLQNDRFFVQDIIGCRVVLDNGVTVGEVTDVLQYGAADVYVCQGEKCEISFPALKDLLLSVSIEDKKILLDAKRFEEVSVTDED